MKLKLLLIGLLLLGGGIGLMVFRDQSRWGRMKRVFNIFFYLVLVIYGYVFVKLFLVPLLVKN